MSNIAIYDNDDNLSQLIAVVNGNIISKGIIQNICRKYSKEKNCKISIYAKGTWIHEEATLHNKMAEW